jgi:hypothetical protein
MTKKKQPEWRMGPLSPSNKTGARHFVQPPMDFPAPQKVCNAASQQPLQLQQMWAGSSERPGCHDHAKFRSRGTEC